MMYFGLFPVFANAQYNQTYNASPWVSALRPPGSPSPPLCLRLASLLHDGYGSKIILPASLLILPAGLEGPGPEPGPKVG